MNSILKDLEKVYNGFCPFSKNIIKYGTVLIATLLVIAIYAFVQSEYSIHYAVLYNDVLYCIKECMGSIYILPMLFETISMSVKKY